jgi:chromosome segregation ATPase
LRQLESMERQNRARAAAWAELETKLRTDLEDHVIDNEKLTKERNEYKSNHSRLTRISKDRDEELASAKTMVEEMRTKIEKQEAQIEEMETEGRKMKEEWSEVERLANEGVSKVRSDMMKNMLENEERSQMQQKSIDNELKEERKKRSLLERQVSELLDNAGMMAALTPSSNAANAQVVPKSVQKKLRSAESQGDILDRALVGLGDDEDGEDVVDTLEFDEDGFEEVETRPPNTGGGMSSFAAMEQLSSRLKEAKVELAALRQSLASSERVRASLVEELSETRVAKEKLPLFEAKVQELAIENREKQMEIMSLTEDVSEIRQLYRGQLNTLIEEKAASMSETPQRTRMPSGSGDVFMTPMQSHIDDDSEEEEEEEEEDDDAMRTPMQDGVSSNGGGTPSPGMTSPMMVRKPSGAPLDPSKKD